ncbi:MAG: glycosyltransferase family 4 protein [bacterium]|nr:glycosyltransferase family 4 protein [bacterium]
MKILFVSRYNNILPSGLTPFIDAQATELINNGVDVSFFLIKGKGPSSYVKAIFELNKILKKSRYDLIHGHYGLSGIVAVLQFRLPTVVSLIGCDVNLFRNRVINKFTVYLFAKHIIFVSEKLKRISGFHGNSDVIPYGIDLSEFYPVDKQKAKININLSEGSTNILFASRFDRIEKNHSLATKAIFILEKQLNMKINLVEFKNIESNKLNDYYNACDLFLMTSIREGSPQSIKEAMACNIPIVSTDVGDVKEVIGKTEGCYITSFDPEDVADNIKKALAFGKKTIGREAVKHLEISATAKKIIGIYNKVLEK